MPQDTPRTDQRNSSDDITQFSEIYRVRFRDYDKWTDKSLKKLHDDDLGLIWLSANGENPLWERFVPKSYTQKYGDFGNARFVRALMDEMIRRGIEFDPMGNKLEGLVGDGLGISAENNRMMADRDFEVKSASGRTIVADAGEYYGFAQAAAIEKYRDNILAYDQLKERDPVAAAKIPAPKTVSTLLVAVPSSATNALIANNPDYAKAIREFNDYAATQGGYGAEVSANDAYSIGYMRSALDKILPDANPVTVSDRKEICRSLPAIETAIFKNKPVEIAQAYDAGQLRRIVGPCDDVKDANPTAAMVVPPSATPLRLAAAR